MSSQNEKDARQAAGGLIVAFVGTAVPDEPEYRNRAFSRAGNMFQTNLIAGLKNAGANVSLVISFRPMTRFPRGTKLWAPSGYDHLKDGTPTVIPAFINIV